VFSCGRVRLQRACEATHEAIADWRHRVAQDNDEREHEDTVRVNRVSASNRQIVIDNPVDNSIDNPA
jgi:hypothetical protein